MNHVPLLSSQDSFGLLMLRPLSAFIFRVNSLNLGVTKLLTNFFLRTKVNCDAYNMRKTAVLVDLCVMWPTRHVSICIFQGCVSHTFVLQILYPIRRFRSLLCSCFIQFAVVQVEDQDGCQGKDQEDNKKASSPSYIERVRYVRSEPNSRIQGGV